MTTRDKILTIARDLIGIPKYGGAHKALVNDYNKITPRPVGYAVTYDDDWCDVTVTVVFDRAGASHLIGRECGVQRHIAIFKQKGIWIGKSKPQAGDIVTFDWDGAGFADHIGIVEAVNGNTITTIEGNSNGKVSRNHFTWNDWRIMGYARPKYTEGGAVQQAPSNKSVDELAKEVINGVYGTGDARKQALGAQYDAVQKRVNEILKGDTSPVVMEYNGAKLTQATVDMILSLCKHYDIPFSYAVTCLHFEGLWGTSNVGRTDNNWGGMTWTGNPNRPSGVVVTRGMARPAAEGGHYMHYASVGDFLKDWFYLLRKGGIYQVSGQKSFESCVKGMFKVGGAQYDYAATGFEKYLIGMASRKKSIEQAIGKSLDTFDNQVVKNPVEDKIEVVKDDYEVTINGKTYVLTEKV